MTPNSSCARCGEPGGKTRSVTGATMVIGLHSKIAIVLCDECYGLLRVHDSTVWQWFRERCADLEVRGAKS